MIFIENSKYFLENEFDCIIPCEIHIYKHQNEYQITVYDIMQDIAHNYVKLFDNFLSKDAIDYLHSQINPIIYQLGYETDLKKLYEWSYLYDIHYVNPDFILPNTIKWDSSMKYQNLTSIDLDFINERNIFVTLIDDKIVSYACENPQGNDEKIIDIGVETAENYRGKGYAASNAAALALYDLNIYSTVEYYCDNTNIVSQHLAEKIGFKEFGKAYYYVCYRR